METQSVILDLPDDLYNRYKERATQTQRTIEAELIEVVTKAAPLESNTEITDLVAQLTFLDDQALRRIAQRTLPKKDTARTEALHFKRQNDGLNPIEATELSNLMQKFERWFMLRNEALGLLLNRGQTIAKTQSRK